MQISLPRAVRASGEIQDYVGDGEKDEDDECDEDDDDEENFDFDRDGWQEWLTGR